MPATLKLRNLPASMRAKIKTGSKTKAATALEKAKRDLREKNYERMVAKFLGHLSALGHFKVEREFAFAAPDRAWRFDLAWPEVKLALEVDGGAWIEGGGRHNRGKGFEGDQAKLNAAVLLGWRVLRVAPKALDLYQTAQMVSQGLWVASGANPRPLPPFLAETPSRRKPAQKGGGVFPVKQGG